MAPFSSVHAQDLKDQNDTLTKALSQMQDEITSLKKAQFRQEILVKQQEVHIKEQETRMKNQIAQLLSTAPGEQPVVCIDVSRSYFHQDAPVPSEKDKAPLFSTAKGKEKSVGFSAAPSRMEPELSAMQLTSIKKHNLNAVEHEESPPPLATAKLGSSLRPDIPEFVPSGKVKDVKPLAVVFKGFLESSIHAIPGHPPSSFQGIDKAANPFIETRGRFSSRRSNDKGHSRSDPFFHASSSVRNDIAAVQVDHQPQSMTPPANNLNSSYLYSGLQILSPSGEYSIHNQLKIAGDLPKDTKSNHFCTPLRRQGNHDLCQVKLDMSEANTTDQSSTALSIKSSDYITSPLVPTDKGLAHSVQTKLPPLCMSQLKQSFPITSEGPVKLKKRSSTRPLEFGPLINVAPPKYKEGCGVMPPVTPTDKKWDPFLSLLDYQPEDTAAAGPQGISSVKHEIRDISRPSDLLFKEMMEASNAFGEKAKASRGAGPRANAVEEIEDVPGNRQPAYKRILGSALDDQCRRLVLKRFADGASSVPNFQAAARPLHLKFQRVILKLLLANGAIKSLGHLDGPAMGEAEMHMHLYISETGATSITLVGQIHSTGNDFLVLNATQTRPLLEFNVNFMLPGRLDTDTMTVRTVPAALQSDFPPKSPVDLEIDNLRNPSTRAIHSNLRHISFAINEYDFAMPEEEDLPNNTDYIDHPLWDPKALHFFDFLRSFKLVGRKVVTMLFTEENHSAEEVDEFFMAMERTCNLQKSLWHDHGMTWQLHQAGDGKKAWILKGINAARDGHL